MLHCNNDERSGVTKGICDVFRSFAIHPDGVPPVGLFPASQRPVVEAVAPAPQFATGRVARTLDLCIAVAALVFFAPLMIIVAIAVMSSGGPVFFGQWRIGRGGASFKCLKFRTMLVNGDAVLAHVLATDPVARAQWERDRKLTNDPRVTAVGALLRKFSLDELPQLFNVLAGDMSIVGPRPIVAAEIARYGRYFTAYCEVRPGITGLWQISGRSRTTYRRRIACDVTYVRSKSAVRDMQIIFRTVPAVCLARGAY